MQMSGKIIDGQIVRTKKWATCYRNRDFDIPILAKIY